MRFHETEFHLTKHSRMAVAVFAQLANARVESSHHLGVRFRSHKRSEELSTCDGAPDQEEDPLGMWLR